MVTPPLEGTLNNRSGQPPNQAVSGNHNITALGDIHITGDALNKLPSLLAQIVPTLSQQVAKATEDASDFMTYEIEQKISHNKLNAFKHCIEEYGQYGSIVDSVYEDFDNQQPGGKSRILNHLRAKYNRIKSEIIQLEQKILPNITALEAVQKNADEILNRATTEIREEIITAQKASVVMEDLDLTSMVIVCHGFINCKILEKPPTNAAR